MGKSLLDASITQMTAPALTDRLYIVDDPAGTPADQYITVQDLRGTYDLVGEIWNASPADSTTYYFGSFPTAALSTSNGYRPIFVNKAGTITRAHVAVVSGGGSAETSSLYIRTNGTTDYTLSTTLALNSATSLLVTGLSISMSAGQYVELKLVTPAWATNPTGLYIKAFMLLE